MHRPSRPTPVRSTSRHYQPLVIVPAAAVAGICLDRYAPLALHVWFAAATAALVAWGAAYRRHRSGAAAMCLLTACAATAGAWHHCRWYLFSTDDIGRFAAVEPRSVALEAVVSETPRVVEPAAAYQSQAAMRAAPQGYSGDNRPRTRFEIEAVAVRDGERWLPAVGRADVQIDGPLTGVFAGERVRLFGRISASPHALNPGEFDFALHYRAERKLCIVRVAGPQSVTVVSRRSSLDLFSMLSDLRYQAQQWLLAHVARDQVGFASALLLGYRDLLDRRDNWAFFRTGTVHVLSISGLHIGMLALFLHGALRLGWLRRTTAIVVTVVVIAAYALLIDAEPPAVRAVVIVLLAAVASLWGRRALSFNVLGASALLVLAINPCDLFRTGPQLSFLAAAVLAWRSEYRPREESDDNPLDALGRTRGQLWWRAKVKSVGYGLLVSSLIFLVTTPLVAYRFKIVSPISLLLTPLLALPVAVALACGFLTLSLGWLVPPLAAVFGGICGRLLQLIDFVVDRTQFWPGAAFWLPGPALWQVFVFYGIVAAWIWMPPRPKLRQACGVAACAWCVVCLLPRHELPPDVALRTTFISVGHGLSVLVERGDGQTWLYDCGRMYSSEGAARSVAAVLWSRGVTRLDAVVVSHGDADHYNALPYVLEQFRPRKLIVAEALARKANEAFQYVSDAAEHAGIPLVLVSEGEALPLREAVSDSQIWHPPPAGVVGKTDNPDSIVVVLESAGRRILLTGDLEGEGLRRLLARAPVDCDIVLAPHHGSSSSNPPGTVPPEQHNHEHPLFAG